MDTLPFEAELKRYLQFIRLEKGLADHTVSAYITDLRRYFLFIRIDQKLQSLDGVTLDHIENYLGVLTDLGLATSSMARNISDRKSTRLNSSHVAISYAVFCLKKKTHTHQEHNEGQQSDDH